MFRCEERETKLVKVPGHHEQIPTDAVRTSQKKKMHAKRSTVHGPRRNKAKNWGFKFISSSRDGVMG